MNIFKQIEIASAPKTSRCGRFPNRSPADVRPAG